jgi:hypothetical protein
MAFQVLKIWKALLFLACWYLYHCGTIAEELGFADPNPALDGL